MNKYRFYPLTSQIGPSVTFFILVVCRMKVEYRRLLNTVCGELDKDNRKFMPTLDASLSPRLVWRSQ